MLNIFPYETIAKDNEFIGRSKEIEVVNNFLSNSNNLVIFSKRRMGKSSLIRHVFSKNSDAVCIYADAYDMLSAEDFGSILLKALTASYKTDIKTTIKKLGSYLTRVRLEPTIDPNTYEYSIKPNVKTLSFEEILEDFFATVNGISKDKKVVIAIDEFQQIATIKDKKIDATLRKYIQESENISYIFLGSKRHLLNSMFEYSAPLFEMATPFELEPLELEDITNYVQKHLDVSNDLIDYIYKLSDRETKLMQHIFHILYVSYKEETISQEHIDSAIEEILKFKTTSYRTLLDTFTLNQKIAFKLVAKYRKGLFTKDVLSEYNMTKQTMQSALGSLFEREIIDRMDDEYFIPDRTLELWAIHQGK